MSDETCTLIVVTNDSDEDGFQVESRREIHDVWCEEKSVRLSEFYEGYRSGIRPRIILELRVEDWELSEHRNGTRKEYATKVVYDGDTFDVIRTYKRNKSRIQVTLG